MSLDQMPPIADRPRFPDHLGDVRQELDAMFRASPMNDVLGISLDDWGPGWARLSMSGEPAMGNLAGSVHGGAVFTLADAAFEVACNSWGRLSVALETTVHYHRPAPIGSPLIADGWEVSRGGRTATYRLQVADQEGQVLTSYLALAYRTSRWHVEESRLPEGFA